jgi:hypothetical protein
MLSEQYIYHALHHPLGVGSSLRRIGGKAPSLRSRPEGPDLHNRRSSTYGIGTPPPLPVRQNIDGKVLPSRQRLYIHPYRRSSTCGYEDRALRATERKAGALPPIRRRLEPTPSGEILFNPDFNYTEFGTIKNAAGTTSLNPSNSTGLSAKNTHKKISEQDE